MIRICVDIYLYYYYTCEGIDLLADGMCLQSAVVRQINNIKSMSHSQLSDNN